VLCGSVLTPGEIVCGNDARYCSRIYGRRMFASSEMEVVTVPLEHRDELLGVYTVFVDRPGLKAREDILDLLSTVGHHLGVAIAKQRSDAEARRLSIVEERNSLAHELHDSLAQTLASLRFQCRMLTDSLRGSAISLEARNDLSRIRNGLDEAHTELRELLASFRAPLDRRGLVPALEKLTRRFGQETGAHVLFQNDCRPFELSASEELQILRIVQESLANIRKHSQAHTVRVLLTRESGGQHVLLIEDDGVGFSTPAAGSSPGEHIGLTIMEERARRIGAELRIESEAGEGTRVEVIFDGNRRARVTAGGGGLMRVLLIDDHALFRFGLQELLERRGIQVVAAVGDTAMGLRRVAETLPDVVLLDMRMPQLNGLEMLRRLRAAHPTMPIAMLTTSAEERDVIDSLQSGAQGYLLKDMEPDA
jgi:two-component system, NarL family, nitrate/nitrite sensor histidine kinase NarX